MRKNMNSVQVAIQTLKEMVDHNDFRIKTFEDLERSWNLDSPDGLVREIITSWEKDSRYIKAVIRVLESKPKKSKKRKKYDSNRSTKSL